MFMAQVAGKRSLSEPPAVAGGFYAEAESSHTNELAHPLPQVVLTKSISLLRSVKVSLGILAL
jgi:hypothetical protein